MTSDPAIAARVFTLVDQRAFAHASGDFNPLHLDVRFARRTQMGAPVVHGIHTVLWALESVLRSERLDIKAIRVRFHQPLFLDEVAELRIGGRSEAAIDLEVSVAGTVIAAIKVSSRPGKVNGSAASAARSAPRAAERPVDLPFEQLADQRGAVAPTAGEEEICRLFPAVAAALGAPATGALMATSRIVGMLCPGLHSLFGGLDVTRDAASDAGSLGYAVSKIDARFGLVHIDIAGSGLTGRIDAFARPRPPAQADMAAVAARIAGTPFAGQRALIVGGSRGLGEVTARIIAAGSGHPVITFREGREEAEQIAAGIRQAGHACDVIRYDALRPADQQLAGAGTLDSCYYFATTRIFQRKSALFEPDKFRLFLDYYVDGFFALCSALERQQSSRKVAFFYPSSTALDTPAAGIAEYAMAKAAGETLAGQLNAFMPEVNVVCRRLPRIATDQTATVGVASAKDALDVLLPVVHEVQQAARLANSSARG